MSKTIEFVNRKIKDKKDQLKRLEKLKVTSNKYELQVNELLTKNTEEDIEHLEKIKCELEAWEVVKEIIRDSNGVYLLRVDSDSDDDKEYYEKLKKALEGRRKYEKINNETKINNIIATIIK